ncbi:MAG: hypothetical protein P9L99_07645 [Candidatus Lernaella stagnicola]|nr:hypothetical protein [Candidatus Lernaella stagnicola]
MKRWRLCIVLFLCLGFLTMFCACLDDDDDDNDDNNDTAADDDDDDNDDDDNDDDNNDDDDNDDDDNDDDDDDNDNDNDTTDELLFVATDDSGSASWHGGAGGWVRSPIPDVLTADLQRSYVGPMLAVDGREMYAAINVDVWISFFRSDASWTVRHHWLRFTRGSGWRLANEFAMTAPRHIAHHLGMDQTGALWAESGWDFEYNSYGFPEEHIYRHNDALFSYDGNSPQTAVSFGNRLVKGLDMSGEGFGLAVTHNYLPGANGVWAFDGAEWSEAVMPAGFNWGYVTDLRVLAPQEAVAVFAEYNTSARWIVEIEGDTWTKLDLPAAGCETSYGEFRPYYLDGVGAHVVVFDPYHVHDQFAERVDGQWTCRTVPSQGDSINVTAAATFADGRAFVAAGSYEAGQRLYEVLPGDLVEIPLPEGVSTIRRLVTLGASAPARQQVGNGAY